jgi:hypothetical protein
MPFSRTWKLFLNYGVTHYISTPNKMIKIKLLLIIIFFTPTILTAQEIDSLKFLNDLINKEYDERDKYYPLEFSFETDSDCLDKGIQLLSCKITDCDSITDKKILPTKFHYPDIKSRIIDIRSDRNQLKISLIGKSQCCAIFKVWLEYVNDSTINLKYRDIADEMCYCGNCPYVFDLEIKIGDKPISKILLNDKPIEKDWEMYDDAIYIIEENKVLGERVVKTYIDNGSHAMDIRDLRLIETTNTKTNEVKIEIYDAGFLIKN